MEIIIGILGAAFLNPLSTLLGDNTLFLLGGLFIIGVISAITGFWVNFKDFSDVTLVGVCLILVGLIIAGAYSFYFGLLWVCLSGYC